MMVYACKVKISLGSRLKRPKIVDSEFRVVVVAFKQIFCSKKTKQNKTKTKTKQKKKNLASIF